MAISLHIETLGHLRIHTGDDKPIHFVSRRAELLLVYLAVSARPHNRELLATLLWDDREQKQALANLRSLLTRLPKAVKPFVSVARHQVALINGVTIDAVQFETALTTSGDGAVGLEPEQREAALALYSGAFLAGVHIRDSRALVEWMAVQREKFGRIAQQTHRHLAITYLHQRQFDKGIRHAQSLVNQDSLHEGNHRLLMRLYAHSGQRAKALQQFEQCRQLLQDELSIQPDAETVALENRIRHAKAVAPHRVPPRTRFVGRKTLLAQTHRLLDEPTNRLLSLVGMGGSGKTSLAIQAAHDRKDGYLNGIFFVSLVSVTSQSGVMLALSDAIAFEPDGERPLDRQLVEHLQDHEALIIFDNFEQVVDAGTPFLSLLLANCPRLKLLVTSRERLNLRAEQLLNIGSIESRDDAEALFRHYAGDTFKERSADSETVWEICQLVDRLPLGIELAASALAYQSLAQISAELQTTLSTLQTSQRDTPQRHRSLDAVFDYSWRLLTPGQQHVLANCASFLGGFSAEAAYKVASAKRQTLRALVDKSLLRVDADGRFHVHELLREFSAEKITDPYALQQALADYFLTLLIDAMKSGGRAERQTISAEWENMLAAILRCAKTATHPLFLQSLDGLSRYCFRSSSYHLALDTFTRILTATSSPDAQRRIANRLARFHILLSNLEEAEATLEKVEASTIASDTDQIESALLAQSKGSLAAARSDYATARQQFTHSLAISPTAAGLYNPTDSRFGLILPTLYLDGPEPATAIAQQVVAEYAAQGDNFQLARARTRLANVVEKQGDWREAEKILRLNLELQTELGDDLGVARTYALLADKLGWQEQYEAAIVYCRQALDIYYRLGVPLSIAIQLGNLGTYYHVMADYVEAQSLYEESARLSEQLGDRIGTVYMLQNLGELCQDDGRPADAIRFWERSLTLSIDLNVIDRILNAIAGIAITRVLAEDAELAQSLLHFVAAHESTFQATLDYIEGNFGEISAETQPSLTLDQAIASCQTASSTA